MSEINISDLAGVYSELIDLDDDCQQLLHSAIERSIDARQIVGGQVSSGIGTKLPNPLIAGGLFPAQPQQECPVLINGIVICDPPKQPKPKYPPYFPIGKIANTKGSGNIA